MNILITGASGFIGSHLVSRLAADHYIYALLRNPAKAKSIENPNVTPIISDITNKDQLQRSLHNINIDAIYHLAAATPIEKNKKTQRDVNVSGSINLISSLDNISSIKTFVYASGLGIYGDVKGKVINEHTPFNPNTEYATQRLEVEDYLHKHGVRPVIMRLGEVYGNGGWFKDFIVQRMRKKMFKIPGDGQYFRSFVHISDAVDALSAVVQKGISNDNFIVVDDLPVTFKEFIHFTADLLGLQHPGRVPSFIAKAIVGSDLVNLLTSSIKADNSKVKQVLGWKPMFPTCRQGLEDILMKSNL